MCFRARLTESNTWKGAGQDLTDRVDGSLVCGADRPEKCDPVGGRPRASPTGSSRSGVRCHETRCQALTLVVTAKNVSIGVRFDSHRSSADRSEDGPGTLQVCEAVRA